MSNRDPFIDGYFTERVRSGERPDYGYPASQANTMSDQHVVDYWKARALQWMRIADAEASKCHEESRIIISRLRQKIKMLERLLGQQ